MEKPTAFVAYAANAQNDKVADALKKRLSQAVKLVLWSDAQAGFEPGEVLLNELTGSLGDYDFGFFIFGKDDIRSGAQKGPVYPRPNVVFEFGLFAGRHGIERSFVVRPKGEAFDGFSDIQGLLTLHYSINSKKVVAFAKEDMQKMRGAIQRLAPTVDPLETGPDTVAIVRKDPKTGRKILRKVLKTPERREEFVKGVRQSMAQSDLPNFVTIYNADLESQTRPFVEMQYLEGGNLLGHIEDGERRPMTIIEVRRIVHRLGTAMLRSYKTPEASLDLKPSNIMLDSFHEPHLTPRLKLDFAEPAQAIKAVSERACTVEDIVYTAPEYFTSSAMHNRGLADQYRLGVLAFHLSRKAFPNVFSDLQDAELGTLERVCEEVQRHGHEAFRSLRAEHLGLAHVPRQIAQTLVRMVRLAPGDRFATIEEALDSLVIAEQAVLTEPQVSFERCRAAAGDRRLLGTFYDNLINAEPRYSDDLRAIFAGRDMAEIEAKVEAAIEYSFTFVKNYFGNVNFNQISRMQDHAAQHRGLAIRDELFDWFQSALVATICGGTLGTRTLKPFDPNCTDESVQRHLTETWTAFLDPVIAHFKRHAKRREDSVPPPPPAKRRAPRRPRRAAPPGGTAAAPRAQPGVVSPSLS